ncbi:DUF92 domain-containing protein [Flavisolibacter nicotianae]|uniref:DUF92 domain-containing protein n=1 Tax=Flavisolibacter nicotianae TaxID=2364882 RepID=UPI000EB2F09C|nr:DUF92 domain-containing protein [Flavisolibacter nicotianae]
MQYILVIIFLFAGVVESIRHRKLTVAGAIAGGVLGFGIFIGAGWTGLGMLGLFFLLGTLATSWKRKQKAGIGMMQEQGGQRNAGQVLANGGMAGLLGYCTLFFPQQKDLFAFLVAGCFSSAMADTLSSELGTLYGKKFFNILTLKKDQRGLDGVVSLEGTGLGILGSVIIAVVYSLGFGWSNHFFWIVLAGTIGNLADSVLGAALERKGLIGNDAVNAFNTLIAALLAFLFW